MIQLNHLETMAEVYIKDDQEASALPLRHNWGRRTLLELSYAVQLSAAEGGCDDTLVAGAIELAWQAFQEHGGITRATCLAVEQHLAPLAEKAKAYTLICIGHAHIDMNWMWSYDETVSITLDTFRTMLDLMDEYPQFTYAQSQASVYEIVARHDPAMLERIRQRVHEGRWEVAASTWVESDRNMPSAESMARHFLYTRQYLSELLGIDPASLDLDYEPDTFGHHVNVPEVLSDAGVRYYYHCRGAEGPILYRWQAPSGRSILSYREPLWYNWNMDGRCAMVVPSLCRNQGLSVALRVYGVGDHGGGPTRRDIEKIIEMDTWPIFPHYTFGTYHDFYKAAEQVADTLPVVYGEQNFIFDGCYTTQTRIKRGNRHSEQILMVSEMAAALAESVIGPGVSGPSDDFGKAWKNVLFNQFHDILPGSGVADTREHAMALYQEAFALANSRRGNALAAIAGAIDTKELAVADDRTLSRSEGAGVGFPTGSGVLARTARHAGMRRLFMVWNPLPFDRTETCELTVWDWPGHAARLKAHDGCGEIFAHQLQSEGVHNYWGHRYVTVLVRLRVPAGGYRTVVIDEEPLMAIPVEEIGPRVIKPDVYCLENELIKVAVSESDGTIISFVDKETGRDYADPCNPLAVFRLIQEDAGKGMTAWVIGAYRQIESLHRNIRFTAKPQGTLRQSIAWESEFGSGSLLNVILSLDPGERQVRVDVTVRWQEIGSSKTVPQLSVIMPACDAVRSFTYDVPMGLIERSPLPFDVPAQSFGLMPVTGGRALMLTSDSKYGYRGTEDGLALTLIRSSIDPDPWPEIGEHQIRLSVGLADAGGQDPVRLAAAFCHPLTPVSMPDPQSGTLPLQQSLLALDGQVMLSAVKQAEHGDGMIVRFYALSGETAPVRLELAREPRCVEWVDLMEQPEELAQGQPRLSGRSVLMLAQPFRLHTIRIMW